MRRCYREAQTRERAPETGAPREKQSLEYSRTLPPTTTGPSGNRIISVCFQSVGLHNWFSVGYLTNSLQMLVTSFGVGYLTNSLRMLITSFGVGSPANSVHPKLNRFRCIIFVF